MTLAPRTLASLAIPKPKISLQFLFRRGVWGEPAKNGKENFWFWFRRFIPPERTCIYILAFWRYFVRPFLRHLRRCEALPVSAFCGSSIVRSRFATTSHGPFAFAHDACSVFASCSLCGFVRASGNSNKRICARHKQIYMCLPHPPSARTKNTPFYLNKSSKRVFRALILSSTISF